MFKINFSFLIEFKVQGHVYAVLQFQNLDEGKLIKLKNPHGREWSGDWTDNSYKYTPKIKTKFKRSMLQATGLKFYL